MKKILIYAALLGFLSASEVDTLIKIQDEEFTNDSQINQQIERTTEDAESRHGTEDNSQKFISCYLEDWALPLHPGPGTNADAGYWTPTFKDCTHVLYSFLTLSKDHPDPPPAVYWDGQAIYDT